MTLTITVACFAYQQTQAIETLLEKEYIERAEGQRDVSSVSIRDTVTNVRLRLSTTLLKCYAPVLIIRIVIRVFIVTSHPMFLSTLLSTMHICSMRALSKLCSLEKGGLETKNIFKFACIVEPCRFDSKEYST